MTTLPVSAAVLAGGASRRMGRDKALLPYRGRPLLQAVLLRVEAVFPAPFVVTNTPERYPFLSCPTVPDRFPGKGPLAGIEAALRHASAPFVFVCACDMPFLSEPLLRLLAERASGGTDLVLPCGPDGAEPLCAVWGKTALPAVESALGEERLSLVLLAAGLSVRKVSVDEVAGVDPEFASFRNFNTPEDFLRETR